MPSLVERFPAICQEAKGPALFQAAVVSLMRWLRRGESGARRNHCEN
jgi:hypothetical protein